MATRTQASLSGFIASDPQLSYTSKGEARFYARIGQEHYRRNDDGSFTELEPTFHNLVVYRTSAQRAHERFAKGDNFVAEGYVHPFEYERDGQTVKDEEFVAKKIGHDNARTSYEVDRTRRRTPGVEQAIAATPERSGPAPIPDAPAEPAPEPAAIGR